MSANEAPDGLVLDKSAPGLGLVWGVRGIGTAIGRSARETYHLIETGQLPVRMIGRQYYSTIRELKKCFKIGEEVP